MIHKILTRDLQPGMYIVDLNLSPQEFPLVYSREGLLLSPSESAEIARQGFREAFVDDEKSTVPITTRDAWAQLLEESRDSAAQTSDLPDPHTMRGNLEQAVSMYTRAVSAVGQVFEQVLRGKNVPVKVADVVAETIVDHIVNRRLTLATVTKLQVHDNYTFAHCVNVSILATLFGRHMGLEGAVLHNLALAGLLHDIGKTGIPYSLLNTARPLNDDEFRLMKSHVTTGYEALKDMDAVPDEVKRAVLEHHERYDGTGYPNGLRDKEISPFGSILAVVDVYDALTSKKPYKPALLPYIAVSFLYGQRGQSFDPAVVERFIQCMGVYPVGSVVRLTSGETAVVYQANPDKPLFPIVSVVMDEEGTKRPMKMMNLGQDGAPRIQSCLDPVRTGINCSAVLKACAWAQRKLPQRADALSGPFGR